MAEKSISVLLTRIARAQRDLGVNNPYRLLLGECAVAIKSIAAQYGALYATTHGYVPDVAVERSAPSDPAPARSPDGATAPADGSADRGAAPRAVDADADYRIERVGTVGVEAKPRR